MGSKLPISKYRFLTIRYLLKLTGIPLKKDLEKLKSIVIINLEARCRFIYFTLKLGFNIPKIIKLRKENPWELLAESFLIINSLIYLYIICSGIDVIKTNIYKAIKDIIF